MDISLSSELENVVKAKAESGLNNDTREVVGEWLAREASVGFAQLEAGLIVEVESKEHFMTLARGGA